MFTFSVCCFWAVFGAVLAGYYPYLPQEEHQPYYTYTTEYAPEYNNYEPKDYQFDYAVSDPHTGDHKSHWEVKEKGVVRGSYSLLEPDGTTRIVDYIADDHGFRAIVKKVGTAIHPHHHQSSLVPLPEAYNGGYSGAYSGLGENYGLGAVAVPVENYHTGSVAIPVENYDTGSVAIPVESYDTGSYAIHDTGSVAIPHTESVAIAAPVANHGTSVEIHGYTGNADDDSSYVNYDYGNVQDNHPNGFQPTSGWHQNSYVQPKLQAHSPSMSYHGTTYWG